MAFVIQIVAATTLTWHGLYEWAEKEGKIWALSLMMIFALIDIYHILMASYRDPGFCIKHTEFIEKEKEAKIQKEKEQEEAR